MIKRVLSLLLALCLVGALLPATAGAANCVEVRSATELAQAMADTPAQTMGLRAAAAAPVRVLVLEPVLPDACGAQRVLHYAGAEEYILEFATLEAAEAGYAALTGTYGLKNCWLDTPEQGAHVLDDGAAPMEASSWGASYMHLTSYRKNESVRKHFDDAQTVVAIIDSGVDPEAENLTARSYLSYDFAHNTTVLSDVTETGNARGHGTRVASILDSMLPENVRFMYLRVFEGASAGRIPVLTAIQYATEQGADVINFSLGWEDDFNQTHTFLDQALQAAYEKGVTIVCAAGNEHQDVENCYPARSSRTIAVSAVNQMLLYESYYSNYGAHVDFCAPGSGIKATTLGGELVTCVGTSFAAPHITAAAAELKILEPEASAKRIYDLLMTYSNDLGAAGKDNNFGWGIPVLPDDCSRFIRHTWDGGRTTQLATDRMDGERLYTCTLCGAERWETIPYTGEMTGTRFVDVPQSAYFAHPVCWAVANGITSGTDETHFSPDAVCTRAQVVAFLWRTAGSPQPKSAASRFLDVQEGAYYSDAVCWAVENGITNGTGDLKFHPEEACTRAQIVTFLRRFDRAQHSIGLFDRVPANAADAFTDVPSDAWFAEAVAWAVHNGITVGTSDTTFSPEGSCTRAQIVTFLYRYANQ